MVKGSGSGQDGTVGGAGQGDLAVGVRKTDSVFGKKIEIGGIRFRIAVAAQSVGPGRIKGYEQDIEAAVARDLLLSRAQDE